MNPFPEETYNGKIPKGCKLCAEGAKLVLFMTGVCLENCYYCPLSTMRKGKWGRWANERRIIADEDILDEAKKMDALGAGITGGDPILVVDDTIKYATLLKDNFEGYHIHLYTPGSLVDRMVLGYLENVVDEIRFHPRKENWPKIETALSFDLDVGAEIPVIPGRKEEILEFAKFLDRIGANFLNLNELEYSETNIDLLRKRGMCFSGDSNAVLGSRELALEIVEQTRDLDLSVHFCSSNFKDGVQLRERLKRRARNVKKKYEDIEDCLIVRGEIETFNSINLEYILKIIEETFEKDDDMIEIRGTKILTSWAAAEELKEIIPDSSIEFSIIKEYPIHKRKLFEKEIL
ncbi:MAG: radical SAM protein [Candidatus Methanofastidiosia archaeon]